MNFNKIIVLLIIILLVAGAAILVFSGHSVSKEDSVVKILNNKTLNVNDSVKVKLTDLNNNPIVNENVVVSLYDSNASMVTNQSIKTGNNGEASLNLTNVSDGNYTVKITFGGNNQYNNCSLLRSLNIFGSYNNAEVVTSEGNASATNNDNNNYGDSGSYYSNQSERTISAGEVELGPDGNYWRHNGNNEWEIVG